MPLNQTLRPSRARLSCLGLAGSMAALTIACGAPNLEGSNPQDTVRPTSVDFISIVVKKLKFTPGNPSQPATSICYAVFASPKGFPNGADAVVQSGCKPVDSTIVSFLIEDLPPSSNGYALSLFQDLNGNGKLDTRNVFGMQVPEEPFGFTNNPEALRAPTYEEVRINPTRNGDKFEISMRSL